MATTSKRWAEGVTLAVAAITVLSGIVQILLPETSLAALSLAVSPDTILLFRLLSFSVLLFGGALLHVAVTSQRRSAIVLWVALQKLGNSAIVVLAVSGAAMASTALAVAIYDGAAGLFLLWYSRLGGAE